LTENAAMGTSSLSVKQCIRPMVLKMCSAVPKDPRPNPSRFVDTFL